MKLIIDDLTDNKRLDAYLVEYLRDFSRSKIQSDIKKGNILVNSKRGLLYNLVSKEYWIY